MDDIYVDWSKAPEGTTHIFVSETSVLYDGAPIRSLDWEKWTGDVVYKWMKNSWVYYDHCWNVYEQDRIKKP